MVMRNYGGFSSRLFGVEGLSHDIIAVATGTYLVQHSRPHVNSGTPEAKCLLSIRGFAAGLLCRNVGQVRQKCIPKSEMAV